MQKFQLRAHPRPFHVMEGETQRTVWLRQIEALTHFADITAGTPGGWLEEESQLSQHGHCWIYGQDSLVWGGASISDNATIAGACTLSHGARVDGHATVNSSFISQRAHITGRASVCNSAVNGDCFIGDMARVSNSHILALQGLTQDAEQRLRIGGRACVYASTVVHQAQLYGNARVRYAFVEHRAKIYGNARIEGNEVNDVWVCDSAQAFDNARIVAGYGEDQSPVLRYTTQVSGNAHIEGNCLLKHRVTVCGNAIVLGGPLQLDNHVTVCGNARICGNVLLHDGVFVDDRACIEATDGNTILIHGNRRFNGEQHIRRMPFYGIL